LRLQAGPSPALGEEREADAAGDKAGDHRQDGECHVALNRSPGTKLKCPGAKDGTKRAMPTLDRLGKARIR
jgi:hypothetical protein